jgi:hypothetical protein
LALSLSAIAGVAAAAEPAGATGKWEVEARDGLVTITQRAKGAWTGASPLLVLRCKVWKESGKWGTNREKDAYLFYGPGFKSEEGDVMVSFDGAPAKKFYGAPSTDRKSFFLMAMFKGTDSFVRALLQHQTMDLVVTPKKQEPLPAISFELAGLKEALGPFLEQCKIKNLEKSAS